MLDPLSVLVACRGGGQARRWSSRGRAVVAVAFLVILLAAVGACGLVDDDSNQSGRSGISRETTAVDEALTDELVGIWILKDGSSDNASYGPELVGSLPWPSLRFYYAPTPMRPSKSRDGALDGLQLSVREGLCGDTNLFWDIEVTQDQLLPIAYRRVEEPGRQSCTQPEPRIQHVVKSMAEGGCDYERTEERLILSCANDAPVSFVRFAGPPVTLGPLPPLPTETPTTR